MRNRHSKRVFNNSYKGTRSTRGGKSEIIDVMLQRSLNGHQPERRRIPPGGAILICAAAIVIVAIGIIRLLNVFQVTSAKPDSEGDTFSTVSSSENSQSVSQQNGENAETSDVATGTEELPPTMEPPPEGSPAYMSKYPEMFVELPKFDEPNQNEKVVYLTFDDGPCATTNDILDKLDSLGVKATFFVTGLYDTRDGVIDSLREIDRRGHEVAVHTYSHDYKNIYASVEAFLDDYKKMDDMIVEATGKRSKIFRFPGGSNTGYNNNIRDDLLLEMRRRGFVHYDWNASNGDSDKISPKKQIDKAISESKSHSQSILLMHDAPGKAHVAGTLDEIVNNLESEGYRFGILDEKAKPIQFSKVEPTD